MQRERFVGLRGQTWKTRLCTTRSSRYGQSPRKLAVRLRLQEFPGQTNHSPAGVSPGVAQR
jgi:hypothetical protein